MITDEANNRKADSRKIPDWILPGFKPIINKIKLTNNKMMGNRYLDKKSLMFIAFYYFERRSKLKTYSIRQNLIRYFYGSVKTIRPTCFLHLRTIDTFIEMFTQGQIYFALFFIITFTAVLVFAYIKDRPVQKSHYRGVLLILLAVLIFLALFIITKRYLLGV
jgi:hypothetical protein